MLMAENEDFKISWEASEYVHHEKNPLWFIAFGVVFAFFMAGIYLLLEDIVSIIVITLMAITVVIFANRKPRTLSYTLDDHGITIDNNSYTYASFKSFSIMQTGAIESIFLEPLERFMPPISIYFGEKDADRILSILGKYLPNRVREPDLVDRLVHRLRL